ncbi:MAG: hypothetical protein DSY80_01075, partial [Desulfocapsa sp.]
INQTITDLNSKIAMQNESLAAIQQARVQEAERRSRAAAKAADEAMQKARAAKLARTATVASSTGIIRIQPLSKKVIVNQKTAKQTSSIVAVSAPVKVTEQKRITPAQTPAPVLDSYTQGQQKYRDGDFKAAYSLFEKSARNKSDQDTSIRSRYMMGECLYKQKQYDQAIIQYQHIISNYPGNPQAAKALLRQGESFEQLSDKETAKIIYKKLIHSYSTSPEAETAQKRQAALQ